MGNDTVTVAAAKTLVWPQVCVLCLGTATKEDAVVIGGKGAPYCDGCRAKVERLRNWEGSTFMIALIIGAILALVVLIGRGADEGWPGLFRVQNWLVAGAAGAILGGIVYVLIWLLLLPLRLLLRSRVAKPGVKMLKSRKPATIVLKFSNPQYAALFREVNCLA